MQTNQFVFSMVRFVILEVKSKYPQKYQFAGDMTMILLLLWWNYNAVEGQISPVTLFYIIILLLFKKGAQFLQDYKWLIKWKDGWPLQWWEKYKLKQ